jgi:hypothetical protein
MDRLAWHLVTGVALLAAANRTAGAQLRKSYDNFNAWFTYGGDVGLAGRWGLMYDMSLRRSGPLHELYAQFLRAGLTYELTPAVRVAAGGSLSKSWPYGEIPAESPVPERRTWQQLQLSQSVSRVALTHRYRVEQRWQGQRPSPDADVDHWVKTGRFRYQLRAVIPLRGPTLDPRELYLSASDEVFLNFGANVQYNTFDQNRLALSLGYRASRALRLEAGFLEHMSLKSSGRQLERNHTLLFGATTSFRSRVAER